MLDLSTKKKLSNVVHWTTDINQLYHPTAIFGQDRQDIVYTHDNLNTTKFTPILLKEWFFLVKKDGYLIIDYKPNEICNWQKLEEYMWWLWKNKYEIIFHGSINSSETENSTENKLINFIKNKESYFKKNLDPITLLPPTLSTETRPKKNNGYIRFICKKIESTIILKDHINKWTFGIVTNGARKDWLEDIINSIKKQNIPEYEILVCGSYYDRHELNFRYIPYNKRDDKGWITKKKNIIAKEAKYQNICIIHDRILFDKNWYKGMKKWGNCFEVLAVPQLFINNKERFGDWTCNKGFDIKTADNFIPITTGHCEYRDWDKDIPGYAGVTIIKKSIMEKNGFNESLYWGKQYDDILMHQNINSKGYILRMNPHAITYSKTKSVFGFNWFYEFDSKKLGKLKNVNIFLRISYYIFYILGFKKNSTMLDSLKLFIKKIRNIKTHQDIKK